MVKKDNNTPNICTAEYTMFEVNVKWPGKMGAQSQQRLGCQQKEHYYNKYTDRGDTEVEEK